MINIKDFKGKVSFPKSKFTLRGAINSLNNLNHQYSVSELFINTDDNISHEYSLNNIFINSENGLSHTFESSYLFSSAEIIVENLTGSTFTDAAVKFYLDTSYLIAQGLMSSDGNLEVARASDNVTVPYWMEGPVNTTSTAYWFKVSSLAVGKTTFNLRYSTSIAYPTSYLKDSIFIFLDDFSGSTINPLWTETRGTPTLNSGTLILDGDEGLFAGGSPIPFDSIIETNVATNTAWVSGTTGRISTSSATGWVGDGGPDVAGPLLYTGAIYLETTAGEAVGPWSDYDGVERLYTTRYRLNNDDYVTFIHNVTDTMVTMTDASLTNSRKPVIYKTGPGSDLIISSFKIFKNNVGKFSSHLVNTIPDPFLSSNSLLLRFEGSNGATSTTDSSVTPKTMTVAGGATLSTANYKIGTSSALFSTRGTQRITTPSHADFNLGTGNWTIESWIRFNTAVRGAGNYPTIAAQRDSANVDHAWTFEYNGDTAELELVITTNGNLGTIQRFASKWSPLIDVWYHVAVTRSGDTIRIFVDGIQIGAGKAFFGTDPIWSSSSLFSIGNAAELGAFSTSLVSWEGYIDGFRLTKGIARYTANFTPQDY